MYVMFCFLKIKKGKKNLFLSRSNMATASASYGEEMDRRSGMKNTLRFDLIDKDSAFQDRITFGRRILFDALNIQPEEIYCLQQSTAKKYYDVTLTTTERAEDARRKANTAVSEDLKRYAVKKKICSYQLNI